MSTPDIVAALTPIVEIFERLSIPYSVAGSVASSAHGVARATLDVDLVADLHAHHIDPFVAAISADYYVDRDAACDAIARRSMFNVVHLATMLKVDIYLLTSRSFDRESFHRRGQIRLDDREGARVYRLDTPEDTILQKLEWYRAGGEVSERQWNDVIGVLQVQLGSLDLEYLSRWARELGVADLLERALAGASRNE